MVLYMDLYWKKKTQLSGALHAACLKSAADGPGAGRYTDFSGPRDRLQKWAANGRKWPKMVENGRKWAKNGRKGPKWAKTKTKRPENDQKWTEKWTENKPKKWVANGRKWAKMGRK